MELCDVYKLLRRYGNCACELKKVKSKKHEIHEFVEKYEIEKGVVMKAETKHENTCVVLWTDRDKMTDEVAKDIVKIMEAHEKPISLESLIGEFGDGIIRNQKNFE